MTTLTLRTAVLRAAVIASIRAARRRDMLGNDHMVANLVEVVCIATVDSPEDQLNELSKDAAATGVAIVMGPGGRA